MEYAFLSGLWILWCALHSAMISLSVTGYLKKTIGNYYRYYRMFFNLVALVTFFLLIGYSERLDSPLVFRWEGCLSLVRWSVLLGAMALFVLGSKEYDMAQVVGLRQIKSNAPHAVLTANGRFTVSGIHAVTRHPWYLGALMVIWVYEPHLHMTDMVVNTILSIYLVIGSMLEERKLVVEFGDSYRRYQQDVSMLLPFKWLGARFTRFRLR
jgi:protein-S-isoprenylcysteine O-methyltransferase Ste14